MILLLLLLYFSLSFGGYAKLKREVYYMKNTGEYTVITSQGSVRLSRFFPAILTFVYTKCRGACYPYVLAIRDEVRDVKNVNFVVLSFDERDTHEDMQRMAVELGMDKERNWIFGVVNEGELSQLLHHVGFHYYWDGVKGVYNHDLLLVGVDRKGNILWEIDDKENLDLLGLFLKELDGKGMVFTYPIGNKPISCFSYDGKGWRLSSGVFLLLLPTILSISLAFLLNISFRKKDSQ